MNASSVSVLALVAYCVHEHRVGSARRIVVSLKPLECTVQDDGRGIGLHRDGYVDGLIEQLTGRRHEVALHGIGLSTVAMSSPLLAFESRREGQIFRQRFAWGYACGPVEVEPDTDVSGTVKIGTRVMLQLRPDAQAIDVDAVNRQLDHWRRAHPQLQIDLNVDTPDGRSTIRPQYHLRQTAHGIDAFDVRRLIRLSALLPVKMVDPRTLPELDLDHWYFRPSEKPTPRSLLDHMQLVQQADIRYPIILDQAGRVMDGMHRVCRAVLDGIETIPAVQFIEDPAPDFVDCDPESLPYDD